MQILMLDARSQAKLKFISSPSKAQHNAFETVLRRDGKPVRQSGPILTNLFKSYAVTDRKDYLLAADFTTRTQNDNLRLSGYLFGTVFQHSRFPDARIAPDFDIAPAVESHTNLSDPLVPCQHHTAHAIADVAEGAEQVGQAAAPTPRGLLPSAYSRWGRPAFLSGGGKCGRILRRERRNVTSPHATGRLHQFLSGGP
jgi:hypothetical protein